MNGIDKITERIKNDVKLEIETANAETKAKCDEITENYKQKAQNIYWKIMADGKREAERCTELKKNAAMTDSKKRMLELKQEMVSEVFAKAGKKLLELPSEQYEEFLLSLAVQAVSSGSEELAFSQADSKKYGKRVVSKANEKLSKAGKKAQLSLADGYRDILGGLIVCNGKIETNCSVETIIELRRNELAGEVARLLFE